jgi:hypothetical protein
LKYFTSEWWGLRDGPADPDPVPLYRAYYESVRSVLPPDLAAAHDVEPLHDATLHSVDLDGAASVLRIALTVHEAKRSRPLTLVYSGVSSFRTVVDGSGSCGSPNAFGDLGYDEVEVLDVGHFEHRLLFASGIELHVRFKEFALRHDR